LAILPELRQAVVTTMSGKAGFIELVGLAPGRSLGRMELPLPPLRETLALLPNRGLGAVVLRGSTAGDERIALFECRAGSEVTLFRMEGSIRSLAFEPEGRFLYAASHGASSLEVIDVREQRVVDRVLLAGEPFGVVCDPVGRRLWALCEKLGHVAFIDPLDHSVFRSSQLPGLVGGPKRVAFSPEGRLGVVTEAGEGCLSLIEAAAWRGRLRRGGRPLELGATSASRLEPAGRRDLRALPQRDACCGSRGPRRPAHERYGPVLDGPATPAGGLRRLEKSPIPSLILTGSPQRARVEILRSREGRRGR
jgi:hypothetical protein